MSERPDHRFVTTLAAAAMMVAGVLHLVLVESHMEHALGAGLFFLLIGIAQVGWSIVYLQGDREGWAKTGLVALALAPSVLYIITRVVRAPWATGPEHIDAIGIMTVLAQVGASVALLWNMRPVTSPATRAALGTGLLLAVAMYGGAIAAENVEMLGAPVAHAHGPGDSHDDHTDHDDHAEHEGHDLGFEGTRGVSVIGDTQYYGPATGQGIADACRAVNQVNRDCWIFYLKPLLLAQGSVPAFQALAELVEAEPAAEDVAHPLAHDLGHLAYPAYGMDVELALGECSYEVFQGCLHGVLQMYFADLAAQGKPLSESTVANLCSQASNSFEEYSCLHGVGHGVMMYTNYAMIESLEVCDYLATSFAERSCYGGVVMENVVGFLNSLDPSHAGHDHGHDEPPEYWVKAEDPAYPCNAIPDKYRSDCWIMQTSLILHFNGGDFQTTSAICDEQGTHKLDCYESLGRDAPVYKNRDPWQMGVACSYGDEKAQKTCVKAFTAGQILHHNNPAAGLDTCAGVQDQFKTWCYEKVGSYGVTMRTDEQIAALCDQAPAAYQEACHLGRRGQA